MAFGCACAGAPPLPAERLAQAEAEVRAAQEIGAERAPQARFHLHEARDAIASAKEVNKEDPEAAARRLEIARAQAELANALAREELARSEAEQAHAQLDALRKGAGPAEPGASQ
jgi:hypothetical protein